MCRVGLADHLHVQDVRVLALLFRDLRERLAFVARVRRVAREHDVVGTAVVVDAALHVPWIVVAARQHQHPERRLPEVVRVAVAGDARPAGRVHFLHQRAVLGHAAPGADRAELHVAELPGDAGATRDLDELPVGLDHLRSLVAHVADVEAAVALRELRHLDDLVDGGERAGLVLEARAEAEGAGPQLAFEQHFHLFDLVGPGGSPVVGAHGLLAQPAEAGGGRDVEGGSLTLDLQEVLAQRTRAAAVLAAQRRGDALAHLARGIGVLQQAGIGVAVHVDEAGGQHQPLRVDDSHACRGLVLRGILDRGDRVAFDHDRPPGHDRAAAAVGQPGVRDHERRLGRSRQGKEQDQGHRVSSWTRDYLSSGLLQQRLGCTILSTVTNERPAAKAPARTNGEEADFERRKRLQDEVLTSVRRFRAAGRVSRDELHDRRAPRGSHRRC